MNQRHFADCFHFFNLSFKKIKTVKTHMAGAHMAELNSALPMNCRAELSNLLEENLEEKTLSKFQEMSFTTNFIIIKLHLKK